MRSGHVKKCCRRNNHYQQILYKGLTMAIMVSFSGAGARIANCALLMKSPKWLHHSGCSLFKLRCLPRESAKLSPSHGHWQGSEETPSRLKLAAAIYCSFHKTTPMERNGEMALEEKSQHFKKTACLPLCSIYSMSVCRSSNPGSYRLSGKDGVLEIGKA